MAGMRRRLGGWVLALGLTSACELNNLAPDATVRVEGRLLSADGKARSGAPVPLFRGGARGADGACLLVDAAQVGPYRQAQASGDGSYRFDLFGDETQTESASSAADARSRTPGKLARCLEVANLGDAGRRAVVDFSAQSETIDVPDLQLWDDGASVAPGPSGLGVQWQAAPAGAAQRVELWSGSTRLWSQDVASGAGQATLPAYLLEDTTDAVVQLASREDRPGSGTTFTTTRTGGRVSAGAGPGAPLSRGAACDVSTPCRLTDGNFANGLARPVASVTLTLAAPATPGRLLVRGYSGGAGLVVESSLDGQTFTEVGRLEQAGAFAEVPLRAAPAVAFRLRPAQDGAQLETLAELSLVE